MKIGILTFHRAYNYGAVLQSYALQETISSIGGNCEIIDYNNKIIEEIYKNKKINEYQNIKEKIKALITWNNKQVLSDKFNQFFNEYYNISKEKYYKKNIKESEKRYDIFFVGSDQVWNQKLHGNDLTYFLDFLENKKKKNSYAASFGTNNIESIMNKDIINNLKTFNKISIREEQGVEFLSKNLNIQSNHVLDPTLLLGKDKWKKIIKKPNIEEKFIVVYKVADTPTLMSFARKVAKKNGCKIICIDTTYVYHFRMKNIKNASIEEFLGYFYFADYVITSSFHGVALSLIFEKEFFYELDNRVENNNSRLEDIAKKFEVEDRKIINGDNRNLEKIINYDKIRNIMEIERGKSISYIKDIIGVNIYE